MLTLVFSEHLAYCRNEGFRTPKTAFPFKVLGDFSGGYVQNGAGGEI
ncbi:MAG: hypothetical protein RIC87_03565 [Kiloniellales bacterium]